MRQILFAGLFLFATATTAGAGAQTDFIESLLADVATINEVGGDKTTAFNTLLVEKFDVPRIGRFLIGKSWRKADSDMRAAYLTTFESYLLSIWANRLGTYSGNGKVKNEQPLKDGSFLVRVVIDLSGTKKLNVGFRVSDKSGSYRIIDVMMENVSLLVAMRSDFKSVIMKQGIEGLIAMMKAKTNG